MPWHGEFGVMVMYWIRYVHRHAARHKVVCCRRGDEVYFPSAAAFEYGWDPPTSDRGRRGSGWRLNDCPQNHSLRRQLRVAYPDAIFLDPFRIPAFGPFARLTFPLKPQPARGLRADVVLGCRRRDHAPERNWPHWSHLAGALKAAGLTVGLIGQKETSFDLPAAHVRAWDCGDASASVELLQNCRLYIGTDTGTSHLASFCSTPMIVFRYPDRYPAIEAMERTTRGFFQFLPRGWEQPATVAKAALKSLGVGGH